MNKEELEDLSDLALALEVNTAARNLLDVQLAHYRVCMELALRQQRRLLEFARLEPTPDAPVSSHQATPPLDLDAQVPVAGTDRTERLGDKMARELEEMKGRVRHVMRGGGGLFEGALQTLAAQAADNFFPLAVALQAAQELQDAGELVGTVHGWRLAAQQKTPTPRDRLREAVLYALARRAYRWKDLYDLPDVTRYAVHDLSVVLDELVAEGKVVLRRGGWYRAAP